MRRSAWTLVATLTMCGGALAQAPVCQPAPGAPEWMPCGIDRTLLEEELRSVLLKAGRTTRLAILGGGPSRPRYNIELQPDGKLELKIGEGSNIGRDWKVDTGALCMRAYQNLWAGAWNCGTVFLQQGKLYWQDEHGNFRNQILQVSR